MELNKLIKKNCINAIDGFIIDFDLWKDRLIFFNKNYTDEKVKNYVILKTSCKEERLISSLKMVNLSNDILNRTMNSLSDSEKLKIELAIALIENREELIFYHFDYYFIDKELIFFKNLFKKLVKKYSKTILFIDSKSSFLLNLVDRLILLVDKKDIKIFDSVNFFDDQLSKFYDLPEIVLFNKYINKNKKIIGEYTDIKDLIKAIYREV